MQTNKNSFYSYPLLFGGLGNQLFEIAHAFAQGWTGGVTPILNLDALYESHHHTHKDDHLGNIFKKLPTINKIDDAKIMTEISHVEIMNPTWDNHIGFSGHFQSSKHFLGHDEKIRQLFLPDEKDIKEIKKKYPGIDKPGTIAVHVRRGDYLMLSSILPTLDKKYYNLAIDSIGDYEHIYVFSDDADWPSKHILRKRMSFVEGNADYFDMWAMSLCNHTVISNSTFSWWGSFLNTHSDKQIYAPSLWFGTDWGADEKDRSHMIHEDYWNIIEVKNINGVLYKTAPGC